MARRKAVQQSDFFQLEANGHTSTYDPLPSVWDGEDNELIERMLGFYPRKTPKLILDATINAGRFWRGSKRRVIGIDVDVRHKPSVLADNMRMPFADKKFDVVVYDPPHIPNQGRDGVKDFNTRFGLVLKSGREKGKVALVDDNDYEWLSEWNWSYEPCRGGGRAGRHTRLNGRHITIRMHRVIVNATKEQLIDHINGDSLDNRRSNLRYCTYSQNLMNTHKVRSASGYKGVYRHRKRWYAHITLNGRRFYLGLFKTPQDAAHAYNAKAKELFGEFACLNPV